MNSINENLIKEEDDEQNIINRLSLTDDRDSGVYYNDFDYEIDKPIDPNIYKKIELTESFPDNLVEKYYKCEPISIFNRRCLKEIVSEVRIRMHRRNYDLDLVYITRRIIAMGYPATGCESFYRNSFADVKQFLTEEHGNKYKVYNLCMEKNRIYKKTAFGGPKVSLFPFQDHQSCPVKLMLEFCIDVCIFLLKDDENVVAIHCKAGKGRTGTMICAYLLFTGVALNSVNAFEMYGTRRSKEKRGVTVPSQRRYIQHFETYLSCNFQRPYFKLIPKIIKNFLTKPKGNLLKKIMNEKNYYNFDNRFIIKKIKIGPFSSKVEMDCKIIDFQDIELFNTENGFFQFKTSYQNVEGVGYYYKIELTQRIRISSDINLSIFNKDIKMNSWINLFFVTLENFIYIISSSNKNHKYKISSLIKRKKRTNTNMYNNNSFFDFENEDIKNISTPKLNNPKKFIEMNTLSNSDENLNFNNIRSNNINNTNYFIEEEVLDEEDKIEFERCFDCNYFWINNIVRDDQKIIKFIKNNTKFKGDDIENLNLNSVYEFFSKENKTIFNMNEKKIKFKIQGYGLDNYARIKNLDVRFGVIVTYLLE
jgi:hypothetical protein